MAVALRHVTETAKADVEGIVARIDVSLYWLFIGFGVQELRPLFSIPGIEPDGQLSITEEFKGQVRSSAIAILASLRD